MSMIELAMRAKNSKGHLHLAFDVEEKEVGFTLYGTYEGEGVQYDFDTVSADDFVEFLEVVKKRILHNTTGGSAE